MAINMIVYFNDVFLPDILLLTQAPIVVWIDGIFIVYYYYLFMYCTAICVCNTVDPRLLPSGNTFHTLWKRFCICSL